MFIGHFGVGFGAKKIETKPSLGTLFMAAQFLDLLWPLLLILGIEKVAIKPGISAMNPFDFVYYPFTHSLLFSIIWGILFGAVYFFFKKNIKAAILLGVLVVSHWILDLIVHIPDLPLFPGSVKVGFGLWNSITATILVEGFIFLVGVYIYSKSTNPENKKGVFTLWGLVIFLILVYAMNIMGPPPDPESIQAVAFVGLSQWLIIAWGYWIDRNRKSI